MDHDYSKGMHWIGHPGSLHPFLDFGKMSVTDDVEPVFQKSLGGGLRARVPRGRPPRSWSLQVPDAHADDVAPLRALVTATMGPYVLVTSDAQVSNVLTPERSVMADSSPQLGLAGAWPLEGGGFAVATRTNPSAAFNNQAPVRVGPAPIPPSWTGRAVTVYAHLGTARSAGAQVRIQWLDSAGWQTGPIAGGNLVTGMDVLRRSTATATPPPGAAACHVYIAYAELIAQPQVTWTPAPIREWSTGNGADRVLITGLSRDTEFTSPDDYALRRSDIDIAFKEVGP